MSKSPKHKSGGLAHGIARGISEEIARNDVKVRETEAYAYFRSNFEHRLTEDNEKLLFDLIDLCNHFGNEQISEVISVISRDRRK